MMTSLASLCEHKWKARHVTYTEAARRVFESDWCQKFVWASCAPEQALYSNCSMVLRSRKAVGPVYMYRQLQKKLKLFRIILK